MIKDMIGACVAAALIIGAAAFVLVVTPVRAAECGKASWYGAAHHGKPMANGRPYNMHAMTAASNRLPLGTKVRVTSGKRSVVVTITDRGGFGKYGRIIDMSRGSFAKLAPTGQRVLRRCACTSIVPTAVIRLPDPVYQATRRSPCAPNITGLSKFHSGPNARVW